MRYLTNKLEIRTHMMTTGTTSKERHMCRGEDTHTHIADTHAQGGYMRTAQTHAHMHGMDTVATGQQDGHNEHR